jgi:signal transduction histidine kinase
MTTLSTEALCLAPIPSNEQARLAELYRFDLLDTVPEAAFDRLTTLAAEIFDAPYSVITLVDKSRHWFKSAAGMPRGEIPRGNGFCGHTIMTDAVMVVADATMDLRFAADPIVNGEAGVRFYAGAPLTLSSGFRIGTLCVMDTEARPDGLSAREISILEDMAGLAVREIEFRSKSALEADEVGAELENAQAAKDQFLQMLSHELRTPLNAIIGFSNLIEVEADDAGNEKCREYAIDVGRAGYHLLRLIDGMLDWTRLERGEIGIDEAVTPLPTMFEQAFALVPGADARVDVAPQSDVLMLRCDSRYVVQVLAHVIDNAIKFSPESEPVNLSARIIESGDLLIEISDRGPGIDEARRLQAFNLFEKFEPSSRNFAEGVGLGLAISRKLIELHGGTIAFADRSGPSTTVALTLPAYRVVR